MGWWWLWHPWVPRGPQLGKGPHVDLDAFGEPPRTYKGGIQMCWVPPRCGKGAPFPQPDPSPFTRTPGGHFGAFWGIFGLRHVPVVVRLGDPADLPGQREASGCNSLRDAKSPSSLPRGQWGGDNTEPTSKGAGASSSGSPGRRGLCGVLVYGTGRKRAICIYSRGPLGDGAFIGPGQSRPRGWAQPAAPIIKKKK